MSGAIMRFRKKNKSSDGKISSNGSGKMSVDKENNNKKTIKTVSIIVGLILVCVLLYYLFSTSGNITK